MRRKTFTSEQIRKLSINENVSHCGQKSVMYRKEFKKSALKQYNEDGLSAVGIFEAAGFDLGAIGIRSPNRLMHQWNLAFGIKTAGKQEERIAGETDMVSNRKVSGINLRTLKAKIAYLEAENDFLEELRARRRK
jgi:hypothetical protein